MLNDVWILIVVFIILGITKDVLVMVHWLENWIRSKSNGGSKVPPSTEKMQELLNIVSERSVERLELTFDKHFQSVLAENRKTNDLLFRFLLAQKLIAKANGVDLGDI
jgi:hypothetical protein